MKDPLARRAQIRCDQFDTGKQSAQRLQLGLISQTANRAAHAKSFFKKVFRNPRGEVT
jgi:hypothetical protein